MSLSKINKNITFDYLKEPENLYFDRKSAKVSYEKLANEIASFANANGGLIAVGLSDIGEIEGFNKCKYRLNECQKVVTTYLKPSPIYHIELINIKNMYGEDDNLLLFHIEPSMNFVVRNHKDEVYCRQGDSSIKLNYDQIRSLEYDRKERNFESEIIRESSIDDIDEEIVGIFKARIGTNLDSVSVLKARGYLRELDDELRFTNAGMLLFGKNPSIYLPCARLRVLKFEGNDFQTGTSMNTIKEKTFDKNLYRTLNEAREFISTQLRDFSYLEENGIFETYPEYPEFAWYEGIVNAITHRDYSNSGEQILVKIYNNRMEILSPGKLGGFVTIDTIKVKRYSRNPQIARALVEFGIVRELNEGVKRIYKEMKDLNLSEPKYTEPDRNSVLLVLENNIENRSKINVAAFNDKIKDIWNDLSYLEQLALETIINKNGATRDEVSVVIGRSRTTAISLLNRLINKELIVWTGSTKNDAYGKYIIK